jgi:hypothetical protein
MAPLHIQVNAEKIRSQQRKSLLSLNKQKESQKTWQDAKKDRIAAVV